MTSFEEIADAVEKSRADMAHRDDLARDAAREWAAFRAACLPAGDDHTEESFMRFSKAWNDCGAALDRLAAAYGTRQGD